MTRPAAGHAGATVRGRERHRPNAAPGVQHTRPRRFVPRPRWDLHVRGLAGRGRIGRGELEPAFKVVALIVDVAVVVHLLYAKRLSGVGGGAVAPFTPAAS